MKRSEGDGGRGRASVEKREIRLDHPVRKIAVVRANALGDYIFALPALEALRHAFPGTEIVLLGQKWHRTLLNGRPGPIDRVEVIPPCPGVSVQPDAPPDNRSLDRFFESMNTESFDLAFQMHGGGRHSNPFVRRLGAKTTIGLKAPDAPALDRWIPYVYLQMEVLRYLEVVGLVGAPPVTLEPRLAITDADRAESACFDFGSGPLVILHPGATDPRRRWPVEKFAVVGDALADDGAAVAVTGVESERSAVEQVIQRMRRTAHNLCGGLSMKGLVGLLSQCQLVISNDTGPLHVAGALGVPTVGIFWCGNLILAGPVNRTRQRVAVSWQMECPTCGINTMVRRCEHDDSFVSDVPTAEVLGAARDLLS